VTSWPSLGIAAVLVSGCTVLKAIEPNSLAPEFEHISHLTQHEPFTSHPTKYGANIANLTAEWDVGKHIYVTLAEGVSLDRRYPNSCGEIIGPREEFTGRVGYKFVLKEIAP
jgi:hypothetical protein